MACIVVDANASTGTSQNSEPLFLGLVTCDRLYHLLVHVKLIGIHSSVHSAPR